MGGEYPFAAGILQVGLGRRRRYPGDPGRGPAAGSSQVAAPWGSRRAGRRDAPPHARGNHHGLKAHAYLGGSTKGARQSWAQREIGSGLLQQRKGAAGGDEDRAPHHDRGSSDGVSCTHENGLDGVLLRRWAIRQAR